MKISIITPVYNDPRVELCLESIRAQRGIFDLEHIVVDSKSTDETIDILNAYGDQIDQLIREDDDGLYDALNKGIEHSTGDVIGILNADDRYQDQSVLHDVTRRLAKNNLDACYGNLVYVDANDEVVRYWESGAYKPYKFYLGWMPPHPTFFVRQQVYEKYGTFDCSYGIAADYELMLRFLLVHDITVSHLNRVLVRMATGGMSNSLENLTTVIREMYQAWQSHAPLGRFIAPFAHPLEKLPQWVRTPPESVV